MHTFICHVVVFQLPVAVLHAILPHAGAVTVRPIEFVIMLQYKQLKSQP